MKFQCVICSSFYQAETLDLGEQINCPNCGRKLVVPREPFDRGRVIGGDFLIDRVLGSGGMGTVYLANQVSLDRHVALKVLSRKYSVDPKFRSEFKREARSVSRLTHTNLVQAYAFGEDDSDLYLAMEYVEGVTLGDRIENETRLVIDEAMNIVQQVAEGLHLAWIEEELIHRDIKPDNIMMTPDGHVKLTDMGLARKAVELENVTEVSGTPAYMNPEQFTKQAMDCRADIYSLGVVLYHSIVGQLPYHASNVREMARQHIQDKVEFPDKTIDIPAEVKKLIRKMMAKKKEERYNDHEDLLKAIYEIRTKLNPHDTIAGVHTLSFNRYEFKNIKPQRKEEDTDVSSTKELPRKKIKPLSSITRKVNQKGMVKEGSGSFVTSNIIALIALIIALVVSLTIFEPVRGKYYVSVKEFLDKTAEDKEIEPLLVIEKIDELLKEFPEKTGNQYDWQAKSRLEQLKIEQLEKLSKVKNRQNNKMRDAYSKFIDDLKKDLNKRKVENDRLTRQNNFLKEKIAKTDNKKPIPSVNPEIPILSRDEFFNLHTLWKGVKEQALGEVIKASSRMRFKTAVSEVEDLSKGLKGSLRNEMDEIVGVLEDGEKIWDFIRENAEGIERKFNDGVTDDGLYISEGEITGVSEDGVTIEAGGDEFDRDWDDLHVIDLQLIFDAIPNKKKTENTKKFFAFALATGWYGLAYKLDSESKLVKGLSDMYISDQLKKIKRYLDKDEKSKAGSSAAKLYERCKGLPSEDSVKNKIDELFEKHNYTIIFESKKSKFLDAEVKSIE